MVISYIPSFRFSQSFPRPGFYAKGSLLLKYLSPDSLPKIIIILIFSSSGGNDLK